MRLSNIPENKIPLNTYKYMYKLYKMFNMCKSSSYYFSRTTTGIKSGPKTFEQSRLLMNFLTNFLAIRQRLQISGDEIILFNN